jgi:hypothetical protein
MKNEQKKVENEMVTIQDGKNRFVEKLGEAIGVKLPAEAGLVKPINILVSFLDSKGIQFLQQISTRVMIEFQVRVFMTYTDYDRQVFNAGIKSFLYLCASEKWINKDLVLLWNVISEQSLLTEDKQICLN